MPELNQKLVGTGIVAAVVGALVGFGAASMMQDPPPPPVRPAPMAQPADPETPGPGASGQPDLTQWAPRDDFNAAVDSRKLAERERDKAVADARRLDGELKDLTSRMAAAQAELEQYRIEKLGPPLRVAFGPHAELEVLRRSNWAELGNAAKEMAPLMVEAGKAWAEGRQPSEEVMSKLGEHNLKLVSMAASLNKKLPSHGATVNGEYSHPLNMVNMLAAHLESAGKPLSDAQMQSLKDLGEEYERRWTRLQQGYTEETFALQKMLDEVELKQWFTDEMWRVTTPEQKALAVHPDNEGRAGLDLYSPGLMLAGAYTPLVAAQRDELKGKVKEHLAAALKVEAATLDSAEFAFDEWLTSQALEPRAKLNFFVTVREALVAGRAHLALLKALSATALNTEEHQKALRESKSFVVPQIVTGE